MVHTNAIRLLLIKHLQVWQLELNFVVQNLLQFVIQHFGLSQLVCFNRGCTKVPHNKSIFKKKCPVEHLQALFAATLDE